MRLGNDIVDSQDTAEHNPRFIDRILSPEEKSHSISDIWIYWAAKEAAYKAIKQGKDIPFHHREFIVAADFRSIRYQGEVLQLKITTAPILALVTDGAIERCRSAFHQFPEEPAPALQSHKARELLLDLAAQHLGLPRPEISIQSDQRIPRLMHQGRLLPHPTSLSHHGRFVAAALGLD